MKFLMGNGGVSILSFIVSLMVLKIDGAKGFSIFFLYQIIWTAGISFLNAIFSAPILICIKNKVDYLGVSKLISGSIYYLFLYSLAFSIIVATIFQNLTEIKFALLFSISIFIGIVRWYIRLIKINFKEHNNLLRGDIIFIVVNGLVFVLFINSGFEALTSAAGGMIAGSVVATIYSLLKKRSSLILIKKCCKNKNRFSFWFKGTSLPALKMAILSDILNSWYIYTAILFFGPILFAPYAFVTNLFKPVILFANSLGMYIRPYMLTGRNDIFSAVRIRVSYKSFYIFSSLLALTFNSFLVFTLIYYKPEIVGADVFDEKELFYAFMILIALIALRLMRQIKILSDQIYFGFDYVWRMSRPILFVVPLIAAYIYFSDIMLAVFLIPFMCDLLILALKFGKRGGHE